MRPGRGRACEPARRAGPSVAPCYATLTESFAFELELMPKVSVFPAWLVLMQMPLVVWLARVPNTLPLLVIVCFTNVLFVIVNDSYFVTQVSTPFQCGVAVSVVGL